MKKTILASLFSILGGTMLGAISVGKTMEKRLITKKELSNKHLEMFLMMNQWVRLKQEKKELSSYFAQHGYKKIAIYGMSYVGNTLLEELKDTNIEVAYGIDKNTESVYTYIKTITIEETFEPVDAIVVTAITFFDEIKENLSQKVSCPIISLKDIINDILDNL